MAAACAALLGIAPGWPAGAVAPATPSPWTARNAEAMARMHAAMMAVPPGENADRAFAEGMLPHHCAAVDMARTELAYGHDPRMRRLATEVIAAQEREIRAMRDWLAGHGGVPADDAPAGPMPDMPGTAPGAPARAGGG